MSNNKSASGGGAGAGADAAAGDTVGGGGGGKSIFGGIGQPAKVRASFVGWIYPAPLDENGRLKKQPLDKGLGRPHMMAVVFPFQADPKPPEDAEDDTRPPVPAQPNAELLNAARAELDKEFGHPFYVAYLYPNPFLLKDEEEDEDEEDAQEDSDVGGGGGGKSILGGAAQSVTYLGQFQAVLPEVAPDDDSGVSSPP